MDEKKTLITLFTFAIFILLSFLLLFQLGEAKLTNWDEAWYADISRNIAQSGNFVTLIWNKEPFFDKPPLYFWLAAFAFKLFGITEFSARLPSAISALALGIVLYFLARLLFNRTTALLSVIVLGSSVGFLYRARSGNLDVLLAFFVLLSIFSFYKAYKTYSRFWFLILGISIALGFLTKGAIAFVFPLLIVFYLLKKKDHSGLKLMFLSLLIGSAISLLWFLASFAVNGNAFIDGFLINQSEKWIPHLYFWQTFSLEYVGFLKNSLKAWFILFVPSLFFVAYRWRKSEAVLLLAYFIVLFLILSFSENKSNWFLVPLYPITSLIIGYSMYSIAQKFFKKAFLPLMLLAFLLGATQNYVYRNEYIVPDVVGDEARVASEAKRITAPEEVLYLTNYYYPTAVYYSERKAYAVYSEHEQNSAWWIKPKNYWQEILRKNNVFIITTEDELEELQKSFPKEMFEKLFQSGSKLLVKKS